MGAQADQVRDDILKRVLSRNLMPGDRVDETDIRDRLNLSGTPVREALISLEATGVVHRIPRGGARIVSLDLEQLMKMIEVLAETEGAAAYRAARRITSSQAGILKKAARACQDHANAPEQPETDYYDVNLAFHVAILDASGNEYLKRAAFNVANRLIGYLSTRHSLPGEAKRSAQEHAAICEAILDTSGDQARDLMIRHVTLGDTLALDVMNAMKNGST